MKKYILILMLTLSLLSVSYSAKVLEFTFEQGFNETARNLDVEVVGNFTIQFDEFGGYLEGDGDPDNSREAVNFTSFFLSNDVTVIFDIYSENPYSAGTTWDFPLGAGVVYGSSASSFYGYSSAGRYRFKASNCEASEPSGSAMAPIEMNISQYPRGTWHHLAMVRKNNNVSFYFNNEFIGFDNDSSCAGAAHFNNLGDASNAAFDWDGRMDNIRVFNESLNSSTLNSYWFESRGYNSFILESPQNYQIYQRSGSSGQIVMKGESHNISLYQFRFGSGSWQDLTVTESEPYGNNFTGYITATIGQNKLQWRAKTNFTIQNNVSNISIGDIFLIQGQSNAVQSQSPDYNINTSIGLNYNPVSYDRINGGWKFASPPIDGSTGNGGTTYPYLLERLADNNNVPVGFIRYAIGGTPITAWLNGTDNYTNTLEYVNDATLGVNRLAGVLWYQGENEVNSASNFTLYAQRLNTLIEDYYDNFGAYTMVTEVRSSGSASNAGRANTIRTTQSALWDTGTVLQGPATYDFELDTCCDGTHYQTIQKAQQLANRWYHLINYYYYSGPDARSPRLSRAEWYDNDTIYLKFASNYPALNTSSGTEGYRFNISGTLYNDSIVESVTFINSRNVKLELNRNISITDYVHIGYHDTVEGLNVLRNNYDMPARTAINVQLSQYTSVDAGYLTNLAYEGEYSTALSSALIIGLVMLVIISVAGTAGAILVSMGERINIQDNKYITIIIAIIALSVIAAIVSFIAIMISAFSGLI